MARNIEVRITISVGPDDNILRHDELLIFNHVESESEQLTLQRVAQGIKIATARIYDAADAPAEDDAEVQAILDSLNADR